MTHPRLYPDASGSALLLSLVALTLLVLLGFFMALNATTAVHISDNYESQVQATHAALAGIRHARALMRGLSHQDLLRGPDGGYDSSPLYLSAARRFEFRTPIPPATAQMLDISDPGPRVAALPDDGVVSTGAYGGIPGTPLIPAAGIGQSAPNPYGPGSIFTSRYFVKVSDNNGEASEAASDPADNPFWDGDGTLLVRSMGISKTIADATGPVLRRNSVAVFEARFKRLSTWDVGPAVVLIAPRVDASFGGAVQISGGAHPGIGAIDTSPGDAVFPDQMVRTAAAASAGITGGSCPSPSVADITAQVSTIRDQAALLRPEYLREFVLNRARTFADRYYEGNQSWTAGSAPDLGTFDPSQQWNAPGQNPVVTLVRGDLEVNGGLTGGGLLIVTGRLSYSGAFAFNGLVLVIGEGILNAAGTGPGIEGGVFVARLENLLGTAAFGTPVVSIGAESRIAANAANSRMAIGLIPAAQIGFREISTVDP